jgi:hypothetical protein
VSCYYLVQHGDAFERRYWSAFLAVEFPSYELFWQKSVVPLTNRPRNIHLKSSDDLQAAGFSDDDICVAQLHYTVLRHLARTFELRRASMLDVELLTEGLVRLTGAQDVAFELLERHRDAKLYDPWTESGERGGRKARTKWQQDHGHPLQGMRDYRNHLVHGRMTPTVISEDHFVPRMGRETAYFDWRKVTSGTGWHTQLGQDLVTCRVVLDDAWRQTLTYLDGAWKENLL